jgi:SAM-dependent methyltransferase
MLERLRNSRRARYASASIADAWDTLLGRREPLSPPRRLAVFIGAGDFRQMGEDFLRFFIELGGLKPDDDVLDIGSGIGRMAVPFVDYLSGRYEGFDIVPSGVDWCQKQISPRYRNFHFQLADIENGLYRHNGHYKACEYRFPYDDASFDFVFATSVLTHLLPEDALNYIKESGRTLREGKTFFATFFLLDEQPAGAEATLDFRVAGDGFRTTNAATPETAVAYRREDLEQMLASAGMTLVSVFPGSWSGREDGLSYQDIVVARKGAS